MGRTGARVEGYPFKDLALKGGKNSPEPEGVLKVKRHYFSG